MKAQKWKTAHGSREKKTHALQKIFIMAQSSKFSLNFI